MAERVERATGLIPHIVVGDGAAAIDFKGQRGGVGGGPRLL